MYATRIGLIISYKIKFQEPQVTTLYKCKKQSKFWWFFFNYLELDKSFDWQTFVGDFNFNVENIFQSETSYSYAKPACPYIKSWETFKITPDRYN